MEPPKPRTLQKKMTKQSTGKLDDSPLHTAARAGNLVKIMGILTTKEGEELKELLLKQNQAGETALYVAAEYGYADLVKEMIKYYDIVSAGIKARNGYDAFHIAAKQDDLAVVKVLLEALPELSMTVDLSNTTALQTAAAQGRIEVVNFMLEVDSSLVKVVGFNGKTALHSAVRSGHVEVVKALLSKEPGIATRTDKKGQTALHMAAKGQNIELVKEIITSDPSLVNMVDNKGNTALNIATRKGRAQAMEPPEVQFEAAEKIILGWDSTASGKTKERMIFEGDGPEADIYLRALDAIQRAMETASVSYDQDKVSSTIQIAMTRLEDEFRKILIIHTKPLDIESLVDPSSTGSWFSAESSGELNFEDYLEVDHTKEEKLGIVCYIHEMDLLPPEAVHNLHRIAERMISAGYLRKCIQTYVSVRKASIDTYFECLDSGKLSSWDVSGLEWFLQEKISKWKRAANVCVRILFASEKVLCERIFEDLGSSAGDTCFMETVKSAAIQLFEFAEAVTISKRSPEKLFIILDLHNALLGLLPDLNAVFQSSLLESIRIQAFEMLACLIEAARGMLFEFANWLQRQTSQNQNPLPGGRIHSLTGYVMNYVVNLTSSYGQTLVKLIVPKPSFSEEIKSSVGEERSPLGFHLIWIMMKLQNNLKGMSKHYSDASLSHIFVVNNIHYMLQKVKGCPKLRELIGDAYFKTLAFEIKQAAETYQESTCMKFFPCLSKEGLSFSSEVSKSALKERFKAFNQTFEETHKTQATWVIQDLQLRDELRISVSEMLIPTYRTFLSRFRGHIGKHPKRYIKYSVEDIESALLDFFEG